MRLHLNSTTRFPVTLLALFHSFSCCYHHTHIFFQSHLSMIMISFIMLSILAFFTSTVILTLESSIEAFTIFLQAMRLRTITSSPMRYFFVTHFKLLIECFRVPRQSFLNRLVSLWNIGRYIPTVQAETLCIAEITIDEAITVEFKALRLATIAEINSTRVVMKVFWRSRRWLFRGQASFNATWMILLEKIKELLIFNRVFLLCFIFLFFTTGVVLPFCRRFILVFLCTFLLFLLILWARGLSSFFHWLLDSFNSKLEISCLLFIQLRLWH